MGIVAFNKSVPAYAYTSKGNILVSKPKVSGLYMGRFSIEGNHIQSLHPAEYSGRLSYISRHLCGSILPWNNVLKGHGKGDGTFPYCIINGITGTPRPCPHGKCEQEKDGRRRRV